MKAKQRLFVAVWPTEEVVERLCELPRKDRPGIKWVPPENWHITLRFLGDTDPEDTIRRLDDFAFEPFRVRYGPGIDVLMERIVVAPVHGLDSTAERIRKLLRDVGAEPSRKRFNGHLTLARLRKRPPRLTVVGAPFVGEQTVEEITLVASRLRPEGPEYETIETFPARRAQ